MKQVEISLAGGHIVKRALRRDPTVMVGIPSELHVVCGCGRQCPIEYEDREHVNVCECGMRYTFNGWILPEGSAV